MKIAACIWNAGLENQSSCGAFPCVAQLVAKLQLDWKVSQRIFLVLLSWVVWQTSGDRPKWAHRKQEGWQRKEKVNGKKKVEECCNVATLECKSHQKLWRWHQRNSELTTSDKNVWSSSCAIMLKTKPQLIAKKKFWEPKCKLQIATMVKNHLKPKSKQSFVFFENANCMSWWTTKHAWFGAIQKKNANIQKTNSKTRCSWVNGSTWAALGLLKVGTISESLFWGDLEKECQHSEKQFRQTMQLGQPKHLGSAWALAREHHQWELFLGQFGKRMPTFANPIPTNDADGPTEALGQHLGSCKGAPSARACFLAIRKKNANIRKTNCDKRCRWANRSAWAALGLLQGSAISEALFVGDSEKEC